MHHMLHLCMAFEQMDLPHQNYPQHWQLIFTIDQKEISHFPYGSNAFNYVTRELLVLPVQLGGPSPSADTTAHIDASKKITAPVTALQSHQYPTQQRLNNSETNRYQ